MRRRASTAPALRKGVTDFAGYRLRLAKRADFNWTDTILFMDHHNLIHLDIASGDRTRAMWPDALATKTTQAT